MPIGDSKRLGHYTGPEDPRFPYPRDVKRRGADAMQVYFDAEIARDTIAAICKVCKRELVAEEVVSHRHVHLGGKARVMAREWDVLPADARREFLAYVKETG